MSEEIRLLPSNDDQPPLVWLAIGMGLFRLRHGFHGSAE
jgi:hypothetical protein